ncbi:MAG: thioredoxin domain-containing protein [Pseudomonadota bacterium]|nr:thioredoxin domain-containing protein [Pseudomonadota bacterium]
MPTKGNRLATETSPYLLQHAGNPVDWHPWGEEALRLAREEDRPILLSIGYSACHWCHVMAHESFEDEATARLMNAHYVNIKVDREERPDLDKIYQASHALLTQRTGGWPLTMFLSPDDHTPFFGGTYFPDRPVHGLPAFRDLLVQVEKWFRQHRDEIRSQNVRVVEALSEMESGRSGQARQADAAATARRQMEASFDAQHGGFGGAPKFPHPGNIEFLMRHWIERLRDDAPDDRALHMAIYTLEKMARGGIYDHLGGGFCRYSVDDLWMIPHFEKMLYDNGQLLALYAEAFAITGDCLFRRTAEETAAFVMREMQSAEGAYYSSLDADSEGEEGAYYVWEPGQVRAVAGDNYRIFARRYGLDRRANFEGRWHLNVQAGRPELSRETGQSVEEITSGLDAVREALLVVRERRVRPGRDEKILTSWNALMIRGMAIAARRLENPALAGSVCRAVEFIRTTLWRDGRLLATCKDGRAHLNAYLDDYAFLIDALLESLQLQWRAEHLDLAIGLADTLLAHFEDRESGGFYFTSDDHETLIQRPKPIADESMPAGNAIAALALNRLGLLLGETRYIEAAERTVAFAESRVAAAPQAHAWMLIAAKELATPPNIIILRGLPDRMLEWEALVAKTYAPDCMVISIPGQTTDLPESLAAKSPRGEVVGYHCVGVTCSPPIDNPATLLERLGIGSGRTDLG